MAGEDAVFSLGFDISSLPGTLNAVKGMLKSQKLIANIAFELKTPQGEIRNQLKKIEADLSSTPLKAEFDASQFDSLPRIRYALYDVAAVTGQATQALSALGKQVVTTGIEYESAFTNVQRVTNLKDGTAGAKELKDELKALAAQIPLTFQEITGIATLGAQLGIASNDLDSFTKTVSQFSAVSNVSTQEAAQSFGALSELLGFTTAEYEKFGSAVAYAGTQAVATESEILSVATQIGGVAGAADFSAPAVVGLSTALASLRVPAEQSRGALTKTFQEINRAVSDGGPALQSWADQIGMSTEATAALAKTDMSAFFNTFIESMKDMDPQQMTAALDTLGLSELRVTNTLTRLASNFDVVTQSNNNAAKAWNDGSFLAETYAIKANDLATKIQLLQNVFANLADSLSGLFSPALGFALDVLINFGKGLEMMANSAQGQPFIVFAAVLTALVGTLLGLITVVSLVVAGTFALRTAFVGLIEAGVLKNSVLNNLIGTFIRVDVAAMTSAAAIARLDAQLTAGTISTAQYSAGLMGVAAAEGTVTVGANVMKAALISTGIGLFVVLLGTAIAALSMGASAADGAAGSTKKLSKEQAWANAQAKQMKTDMDAASDSMDNMGDSAGGAAAKVRTLTDYANDLSTVMNRAFEIRFSGQSTMDTITKKWREMANSTDDARQEIKDLNNTIDGLTSDKKLKEYFLSVAEAYGDSIKAAQLRAEIGDIDGDLAKQNKNLANAQGKTNKTLVGSSDAAIQNRADILGLVKGYQDHIRALAASGASQDELNAATAQSKADFLAQAQQLGYNSSELGTYAAGLDDAKTAIGNIPRDITVDFNTDPALQAINELQARAESAAGGISNAFGQTGEDIAKALEPPRQTPIEDMDRGLQNLANTSRDSTAKVAKNFNDVTLTTTGMTTEFGNYSKETIQKFRDVANGAKTAATEIPAAVSSQNGATKQAFTNMFSPTSIDPPLAIMKSRVEATAASIPGSITLQKAPISAAIADVMGPTNTDAPLNNFKTNFTRTAESIPTTIKNQAPKIAGSFSVISAEGTTAGNTLSKNFATGVAGMPGKVDAEKPRFRASFKDAGKQSAEGYKSGTDTLAGIGRIFGKIFGFKDGGLIEGYANGGYISGKGGPRSDSIPAMLSNGEYVVNAAAVNKYGVGMLDQLNQMRAPSYFAGGGAVSGATSMGGVVSLSPEDRALLRNVGGSGEVVLYANNEAIARSANAGNKQIVATGGRP